MRDDAPAEQLAVEVERRGLGAPARLLADAHRPLAPLIADLAVAFGPLVGAIAGRRADPIRSVLVDESGLEDVVARLDAHSSGRRDA